MPYAQYTRAAFVTELAQALSDPGNVYWSVDELNRALDEALLLWGALTSYWTTAASFPTSYGVPVYDLSTQFSTLRTRAYNFDQLTREIQYHLLEPANGTSGAGMTEQFNIGTILSALARRRNQFVIDTRVPLTVISIPASSPVTSSVPLPDNTVAITRAAWIDTATGIITPLRRSDKFAAQAYQPLWNLTPVNRPYGYSQLEAMPLSLILVPPAAKAGSVYLVCAQTQTLATTGTTSFAIPDEFAWILKYGALHDILSTNSAGYDPIRSKYCLERYQAGIELAAAHRSVVRVRVDNKPLALSTLAELDNGKPYWQTGTGYPQLAAHAYDLLALYRVPAGSYAISCDLIETAPIANPSIQLGREELSYVFDYCRHMLLFKVGGTEFVQTMPLYDNFLAGAEQRTKFVKVKARHLTPLFSRAQDQEEQEPAA